MSDQPDSNLSPDRGPLPHIASGMAATLFSNRMIIEMAKCAVLPKWKTSAAGVTSVTGLDRNPHGWHLCHPVAEEEAANQTHTNVPPVTGVLAIGMLAGAGGGNVGRQTPWVGGLRNAKLAARGHAYHSLAMSGF